jgi:FkbM family methyltransferase
MNLRHRIGIYVRRLQVWFRVAREIHGVSCRDRRVLWAALLAAPISSLRQLSEWKDPCVAEDVTVDVKGVGRFNVRCNSDDLYLVLPSREPAVLASIRRSLSAGDVFIDAGASIGFYTVVASRCVGPEGKVVAIEMLPETALRLQENIRLNGLTNVVVREGALSDVSGDRVLARVQKGHSGRASLDLRRPGILVSVETITLDEVVRDLEHVRMVKMDLEGGEASALRGFSHSIALVEEIIYESLDCDGCHHSLVEEGYCVSPLDGRNLHARRVSIARPEGAAR